MQVCGAKFKLKLMAGRAGGSIGDQRQISRDNALPLLLLLQ